MKDWILSIVGLVAVTSIISLIYPEKNSGKLIKSIFSIVVSLTLISPLINLKEFALTGNFNFDYSYINFEYDQDFLDYAIYKKGYLLENNIKEYVKDVYSIDCSVDAEFLVSDDHTFSIKHVEIILKSLGINSLNGHIVDIEDIKSRICLNFNISHDLVKVYEQRSS